MRTKKVPTKSSAKKRSAKKPHKRVQKRKKHDADISLVSKKQKTSDSCVICLCELENIPIMTSCGHVFHKSCLQNWFCHSVSCPMCRCDLLHEVTKLVDVSSLLKTLMTSAKKSKVERDELVSSLSRNSTRTVSILAAHMKYVRTIHKNWVSIMKKIPSFLNKYNIEQELFHSDSVFVESLITYELEMAGVRISDAFISQAFDATRSNRGTIAGTNVTDEHIRSPIYTVTILMQKYNRELTFLKAKLARLQLEMTVLKNSSSSSSSSGSTSSSSMAIYEKKKEINHVCSEISRYASELYMLTNDTRSDNYVRRFCESNVMFKEILENLKGLVRSFEILTIGNETGNIPDSSVPLSFSM